tara:strand:+ start:17973 stop:19715 length:1743 start_codon:yes stop_codon:yes gene_type:complete
MISLPRLNKLLLFIIFFVLLNINFVYAEDKAEDIWDSENENIQEKNSETNEQKEIKIEGSTISSDVEKIIIKIDENKIEDFQQSIVGIFDPEDNNFSLNMWKNSDGEEIKKVLKRLNKLNLSKLSEELLFQVLFTNAYSPNKNLNSEDFLKIKINWLINKKRIKDLETLLKNNSQVGKSSKAVKYLINEYLSEADIKSACDKINFIDQDIKNDYLDKFIIYCLINNDRQDEAQLIFDLLKEKGFKDNFFENKINFLLGVSNETTQKVVDNDLLNFHLSQITVDNFNYEPTDKTNKYIWKYLGAANLIKLNSFQDEEIIITYEKAAAQNTFDKDEIFKIYLRIDFNFNQLLNAEEIYKTLPNYKSRALIYQSILLNDNVEKKIKLLFLLEDLFRKDKLSNIFEDELINILKTINQDDIPDNYIDLVKESLDTKSVKKIKFNNEILHKSKVIMHFLDDNRKISKTEKDFKTVYKKIKRNKKYFVSIKDIIVLESLKMDGVSLPQDLDYKALLSELTIPQNLEELANQNQLGLVMLKIVEIIGEDNISDLDPETLFFLNKILNNLGLKKIRNNILSEALPTRV